MTEPRKNRPVTIKSIAAELGISFSTVSKALNNNPAIREDTKKLVLETARRMGYTPNSLAKGLRGSSTKIIAIIFNDIENPVLTYIFKNISVEMAKNDYTTMILDSQFSERQERANILTVLSRQPDFVILEPTTMDMKNIQLLSGINRKLILQGARFEEVPCHHVNVDYAQGGYLAASEMLLNGHRRCLVITTPLTIPISFQFTRGIRRAFAEFGVPFDDELIRCTVDSSITGGFQIMNDLWNLEKGGFDLEFTGVITFDDFIAHGVYRAAEQFGLGVPEDLSVIGFDDNPLSAFSMPPLTTVHLPREKMAESCIHILNTVLLEHQTDTRIFSLDPYLMKRASVRNLYRQS